MSGPGIGICCGECKKVLVPYKNDIRVIEELDDGKPYNLWCADLLECPECHHRIISGFGNRPVRKHFEADFNAVVQVESAYRPTFTIDGRRYAMRDWDGNTN